MENSETTKNRTLFKLAVRNYINSKSEKDYEEAFFHYYYTRQEYQRAINTLPNGIIKDAHGMGFSFAMADFENDQDVLSFFAKCLLREIYDTYFDNNLERYLHAIYKDSSIITKSGIKNFMINLIYSFDEHLSGYFTCHFDLLIDMEKELKNIVDNWETFEKTKNIIYIDDYRRSKN